MGVLDTMNSATLAQRTVTMVLDAALQAKWEAVNATLDKAIDEDTRAAATGSLAEPSPSKAPLPAMTEAVEAMEKLREQVAASQVIFTLEGLEWTERVALQAAHPPREGNVGDQMRGHNLDTYVPALIRATVVSVTGADGDVVTEIPDATWDHLLGIPEQPATDTEPARPRVKGKLVLSQVNRLYAAATVVNEGESSVPPSARSLLESQDSGASSTPPSPGESVPDASEGGSRPTPPPSSGIPTGTPSLAKSSGS